MGLVTCFLVSSKEAPLAFPDTLSGVATATVILLDRHCVNSQSLTNIVAEWTSTRMFSYRERMGIFGCFVMITSVSTSALIGNEYYGFGWKEEEILGERWDWELNLSWCGTSLCPCRLNVYANLTKSSFKMIWFDQSEWCLWVHILLWQSEVIIRKFYIETALFFTRE